MYVHMNSQDVEDGGRRFQDSPASCSCSELALRQETHKAAFPSAGPLAILIPCSIAKPRPTQISTLVLTGCLFACSWNTICNLGSGETNTDVSAGKLVNRGHGKETATSEIEDEMQMFEAICSLVWNTDNGATYEGIKINMPQTSTCVLVKEWSASHVLQLL